MFKNLSLGAHTATADNPPTTPAVSLLNQQKYKSRKVYQLTS